MTALLAPTRNRLLSEAAIGRDTGFARSILDRLFVLMFQGFVYNQIWEDPEIDIEALEITPETRLITIASGGCNVLNYLTANPRRIVAVDLNPNHVALTRLKLTALDHLPDYESFFAFFGSADLAQNLKTYKHFVRPYLDEQTRRYWDKRELNGQRRIAMFEKDLYRHSLLGRFIGLVHWLSNVQKTDPKVLLAVRSPEDQRSVFEETIGHLFDRRVVRWLCRMPISFYALGIPPAQYKELESASEGNPAQLFRDRLERLACDFPIETNYFAWQAFGRTYDTVRREAVPRYLKAENFEDLRVRTHRVETHHASMTRFLKDQGEASFDGYVLLDAQDWMSAEQLADLWSEINRTAAPGARVIFRTAGEVSPLEVKLAEHILAPWQADTEHARALHKRDRSSIYGGFHIYRRKA